MCTACAYGLRVQRALRVRASTPARAACLDVPCLQPVVCMCTGVHWLGVHWVCTGCALGVHWVCTARPLQRPVGCVGKHASKRIQPGAVPSAVRQRKKVPAKGGPEVFLAPYALPCGNGWATTVLCCCRHRPALVVDHPARRCKLRDSIPSGLKVCSAAAVHKGQTPVGREKGRQGGRVVGLRPGVPGGGVGGAQVRGRVVLQRRTSSARPRALWHSRHRQALELSKWGRWGLGRSGWGAWQRRRFRVRVGPLAHQQATQGRCRGHHEQESTTTAQSWLCRDWMMYRPCRVAIFFFWHLHQLTER